MSARGNERERFEEELRAKEVQIQTLSDFAQILARTHIHAQLTSIYGRLNEGGPDDPKSLETYEARGQIFVVSAKELSANGLDDLYLKYLLGAKEQADIFVVVSNEGFMFLIDPETLEQVKPLVISSKEEGFVTEEERLEIPNIDTLRKFGYNPRVLFGETIISPFIKSPEFSTAYVDKPDAFIEHYRNAQAIIQTLENLPKN